jgi:hypothetical protein
VAASDLSKSIRRTQSLCSLVVPVGSLKTLPKREITHKLFLGNFHTDFVQFPRLSLEKT